MPASSLKAKLIKYFHEIMKRWCRKLFPDIITQSVRLQFMIRCAVFVELLLRGIFSQQILLTSCVRGIRASNWLYLCLLTCVCICQEYYFWRMIRG